MVLTESTMLPIGTQAPAFALPDAYGEVVSIDDFDGGKALLVAFLCPHCPYVKLIVPALATFARDYQAKGLAVVAINPNDIVAYPDDSPERMAEDVEKYGYSFPYLVDESQETAKAYRAACTPEFYLFDDERKLVYRGRFDGAGLGRADPVTGADLRAATDATLSGTPVADTQIPSIGCSIKWKPGNEPDYFG